MEGLRGEARHRRRAVAVRGQALRLRQRSWQAAGRRHRRVPDPRHGRSEDVPGEADRERCSTCSATARPSRRPRPRTRLPAVGGRGHLALRLLHRRTSRSSAAVSAWPGCRRWTEPATPRTWTRQGTTGRTSIRSTCVRRLWRDDADALRDLAAIYQLNRWVRTGKRPPKTPRFVFAGTSQAKDAAGNSLGGLRLPPIEVPLATYRATACDLGGITRPFSDQQIRALPDVQPLPAADEAGHQPRGQARLAAAGRRPRPDATRLHGAVALPGEPGRDVQGGDVRPAAVREQAERVHGRTPRPVARDARRRPFEPLERRLHALAHAGDAVGDADEPSARSGSGSTCLSALNIDSVTRVHRRRPRARSSTGSTTAVGVEAEAPARLPVGDRRVVFHFAQLEPVAALELGADAALVAEPVRLDVLGAELAERADVGQQAQTAWGSAGTTRLTVMSKTGAAVVVVMPVRRRSPVVLDSQPQQLCVVLPGRQAQVGEPRPLGHPAGGGVLGPGPHQEVVAGGDPGR